MKTDPADDAIAADLDPEAWKGCRILIVDDNEDNRAMLAMVLRRAGLTRLEHAADGAEGLEAVYRARPDLILLDVQMPNMDGLEMCRRLREDAVNANLPVIFQTALSGADERVACFDAGGTDMVAKPINRREVLGRVRNHLEKRLLIRDLSAYRKRVAQELAQARSMQAALAPKPKWLAGVESRLGLSIQSRFTPSSEVGGDLWTMFDLGDRAIGMFIADLTGHGVGAAMNAFRVHAMAIALDAAVKRDPGLFLTELNAALAGLLPLGQFATAFYGVLDFDARLLRYARAGAPGPFLGAADGASMLDTRGHFLAVSKKATFATEQCALPERGYLFLYSDALSEAPDAEGASLGEAGVGARCAAAFAGPPGERVNAVLAEFDSGERRTEDDLTAVWIEW